MVVETREIRKWTDLSYSTTNFCQIKVVQLKFEFGTTTKGVDGSTIYDLPNIH